jgi:predicted nucleotidyltransferase
MEAYRQAARRRIQARRRTRDRRRDRAWQLARRAATLLKEEFGATRVAVFGSLVQSRLFHLRSDIDLAVWGLPERDYYRAVGRLLSLDPDISFDLIEVEFASQRLRKRIQLEGKQL